MNIISRLFRPSEAECDAFVARALLYEEQIERLKVELAEARAGALNMPTATAHSSVEYPSGGYPVDWSKVVNLWEIGNSFRVWSDVAHSWVYAERRGNGEWSGMYPLHPSTQRVILIAAHADHFIIKTFGHEDQFYNDGEMDLSAHTYLLDREKRFGPFTTRFRNSYFQQRPTAEDVANEEAMFKHFKRWTQYQDQAFADTPLTPEARAAVETGEPLEGWALSETKDDPRTYVFRRVQWWEEHFGSWEQYGEVVYARDFKLVASISQVTTAAAINGWRIVSILGDVGDRVATFRRV